MQTPPEAREGKARILDRAAEQLAAYFAGELTVFDLPLAPEGTEFQQKVDTVDTSNIPAFAWMTADQVAEQAIAAVGQRSVLVNGVMNAVAASLYKHLPTSVTTRLVGNMMKPKEA